MTHQKGEEEREEALRLVLGDRIEMTSCVCYLAYAMQ